jgi:2-oxo-4-hydroxy-4-carboxy-5-ureidoimidazoline decarboxylase
MIDWSMDLQTLNLLPELEACAVLLRCCGSRRWVETMVARRPFADAQALLHAAAAAEASLDRADWLEAFAAHPRIGDLEGLKKKFASTAAWASGEQAGVAGAAEPVLRELAEGNRLYESRFGHIFIVCATGKSAEEMLDLLRQRLANDPEQELRIGAAEQAKITRLRLERF